MEEPRHKCHVHFLTHKKTFVGKKYETLANLQVAAFEIYNNDKKWKQLNAKFDNNNAILTYFDDNNVECLLNIASDLPNNYKYEDLYIKCIHPVCELCSNPFGVVDDQLLFECPQRKCGQQYCSGCVDAIQGSPPEHPFACVSCMNKVIPQRNKLIEEHLIWKQYRKLYGDASLCSLMSKKESVSCSSILNDIRLRRAHILSRYSTLMNKLDQESSSELLTAQIILDVHELDAMLVDLIDEFESINKNMYAHAITVDDCLKSYKKELKHFDSLCEALVNDIELLETNYDQLQIDTSENRKHYIQQLYCMDVLTSLSSEQNFTAADRFLKDLVFRKLLLTSRVEQLKSSLENRPGKTIQFSPHIGQADKMLKAILAIEEELYLLHENLKAIEQSLDKYDKSLRDDQLKEISCSKFIRLMEMLRIRTEQLEIKATFPKVIRLMKRWQNAYGVEGEYEPKVIDLLQGVKNDLEQGLSHHNCIYSIPFKVGIIGETSVGKSAIIKKLGNIVEQLFSTVAIEQSTFGYLQFDTFIEAPLDKSKTIPITYIDLEGATDANHVASVGNYMETIIKADCDLYLIVWDQSFNDQHSVWRSFIENKLQRKCLLVRSKADLCFCQIFKERTGKIYNVNSDEKLYEKSTLDEVRRLTSIGKNRKPVSGKIYLTAADCNERLQDAPFATFDMDKLKTTILKMATGNTRVERIRKLAVLALMTTINTCFRRGYIVSQSRFQILAAAFSIVPFLNEVPAFFGREKIRQAFGIHDNSTIKHKFKGTKNSLEEYLIKHQFTVPKDDLGSSCFGYLSRSKRDQATTTTILKPHIYMGPMAERSSEAQSTIANNAGKCVSGAVITLGTLGKISDDAARVIVPTASGVLHGFSIAGIVIGVIFIPICAAWSFYSTGKRMNRHLNAICDDLLIVLNHFVAAVCNDCLKQTQSAEAGKDHRQSAQLSELSSSDEED